MPASVDGRDDAGQVASVRLQLTRAKQARQVDRGVVVAEPVGDPRPGDSAEYLAMRPGPRVAERLQLGAPREHRRDQPGARRLRRVAALAQHDKREPWRQPVACARRCRSEQPRQFGLVELDVHQVVGLDAGRAVRRAAADDLTLVDGDDVTGPAQDESPLDAPRALTVRGDRYRYLRGRVQRVGRRWRGGDRGQAGPDVRQEGVALQHDVTGRERDTRAGHGAALSVSLPRSRSWYLVT